MPDEGPPCLLAFLIRYGGLDRGAYQSRFRWYCSAGGKDRDGSCSPILCASRIVAPIQSASSTHCPSTLGKKHTHQYPSTIRIEIIPLTVPNKRHRLDLIHIRLVEEIGHAQTLKRRADQHLRPQVPFLDRIIRELHPTRQHREQQCQPRRMRLLRLPQAAVWRCAPV